MCWWPHLLSKVLYQILTYPQSPGTWKEHQPPPVGPEEADREAVGTPAERGVATSAKTTVETSGTGTTVEGTSHTEASETTVLGLVDDVCSTVATGASKMGRMQGIFLSLDSNRILRCYCQTMSAKLIPLQSTASSCHTLTCYSR